MAIQGKKLTIEDILRKAYVSDGKVNEDAVHAGLYFISVLETWNELAAQTSDPDLLDTIVMMILNGEANMTPPLIAQLSDAVTDIQVAREILKFNASIMSGEAANNPFIREHRDFLIGPFMQSAGVEIARRKMTGTAKSAADSDKWQFLAAIAGKVAGAAHAIDFSLNLRGAFSHG